MQDVPSYLDLEQQTLLLCVDPRDVNPRTHDRELEPIASVASVPVQAASTVQRNWDMQTGGAFYGSTHSTPLQAVKLEMEEFGDLSSFLPATAPKPTLSNSVDELNTPIFDKDAFDFPNLTPASEAMFPLKFEYDTYDINTYQPKTVFRDGPPSAAGRDISNTAHPDIYNVSNIDSPQSTVDDNFDKCSFDSLSPAGDTTFPGYGHGVVTPEDSNSSTVSETKHRLVLNIPANPLAMGHSVVSTPEVIDEVVNLENATFNILDLVKEDVTSLEADILRTLTDTNMTNVVSISSITHPIPQKRPRKRRVSDDDDEDYIPPSKKTASRSRRDTDDSSDDEEVKRKTYKPRARGRPPRRTDSVSSEGSKDSEASKYRELRDKNNEASRKSRLKRKVKEMEYEKEAEELSMKNVKLKAQVEELEKMVNNFRTNLFKIMINK